VVEEGSSLARLHVPLVGEMEKSFGAYSHVLIVEVMVTKQCKPLVQHVMEEAPPLS